MVTMQQSELQNKVILITGGSRGIGRAITIELAKTGAKIAINYKEHTKEAEEVKLIAEKYTEKCMIVQADVSENDSVKNMIQQIENNFGTIDILVNNAAIAKSKKIDNITLDDWDETIRVNLTSIFLVTQAVIPKMRKKKWGRIINISSTAVQLGGIIGPHYTASKAGVLGLTHAYAAGLVEDGITVNAICPALIATDMISNNSNVNPDRIPVKRLGTPEEVSSIVLMIIQNGYMTGQTINVNGGLYFT